MAQRSLGKPKRSLPTVKTNDYEDKYQSFGEIEHEFKKLSKEQEILGPSRPVNKAVLQTVKKMNEAQYEPQLQKSDQSAYGLLGKSKSHSMIMPYSSQPAFSKHSQTTLKKYSSENNPTFGPSLNLSGVEQRYGFKVPPGLQPDDQKEYILDKLEDKLKDDIESYYKQNNQDQGHQQMTVEEFERYISETINFQETEVGAWVRIQSNYKMLRKKLQAKLIEYISDELSFKNYDVKVNYEHEISKLDEEYDEIMDDIEDKDTLNQRPDMPINYLIRRRMNEEREKQQINLMNQEDQRKQDKKNRLLANSSYKDRNSNPGRTKQGLKHNDQHISVTPETLAANKIWTGEDERKYSKNIKEGRRLFSSKVPSGTFKHIGFKDIYLSLRKRSNLHNLRDYLLEKFRQNKWLTDKELKYLTYSSGLTHAVLDKDHYRDIIQHITAEVKSDIITMIAEDMIEEYMGIIKSLSSARTSYFTFKNDRHRHNAARYMLQLQQENESMRRMIALKKWRSVNWRFCVKRLAMAQLKAENQDKSVKKEEYKLMQQKLKEKKMQERNKFLRRNFSKPIASNFLGLVDPKRLRHLQYPASKVIKFPAKGTDEYLNMNTQLEEELKQTMHDYKNSIVDQKAINPDRYKRLYSGGPVSRSKEPRLMNREQAALLIQKTWRGFFDRRMIKYLKKMPESKLNRILCKSETDGGSGPIGVSKFYQNFTMLKNTLLNPQNEQKFRMQFLEETRVKNQREFTRKIDKEVREKIMKSQRLKKSVIIPVKTQIASVEEIEESKQEDAEGKPKRSKLTQHASNGLHIKIMALLNACKNNKTTWVKNSGYNYTPADTNKTDNLKNTALYYACQNRNLYIIEFLLNHGADVKLKCEGGNTALHAVMKGKDHIETDLEINNQMQAIQILIAKKADLDALNDKCQTPVAFARSNILKRMNLFEGLATVGSRQEQNQKGLKDYNKQLYEKDCREVPQEAIGLFKFRRVSSASTLSHSYMENYNPNPYGDDIYKRRQQYLQSDEYKQYVIDREGRHLKEG